MTDDDLIDGREPRDIAAFWKRAIEAEKSRHKWKESAAEAQEAYNKQGIFNVMWPSVQVMLGSLYSSTPDPEARRRQRDGDKSQKSTAQILERSISFSLDVHDFNGNIIAAITDFLVASAGQVKVNYLPEFSTIQGPMGDEQEVISAQSTTIEHFSWKHFGWQPCKAWERVEWIYYEHQKRRKDVMDEYGVQAAEEADEEDSDNKYVKVYEIWHRPSRAVILIADQFDVPLDVRKDQLGLREFYPSPRPMFTNVATDKLEPSPDFMYYKSQSQELATVSKRITALNKSIKAQSFYDTHFTELSKLQKGKDGDYLPVDDLATKVEGMRIESVIAEVPIAQKQAVIATLTQEKNRLISEVYEILGISDIQRGESNGQDGVETQQLKAEFGAVRIRDKQGEVNRFCRDIFRIMGEIIAEHFEPDILQKITGVEVNDDIMSILRDDFMRNVSVDIETDSTNAGDKIRHQKEVNETMQTAISGIMEVLGAMSNGLPKPVGQELAMMVVRGVKRQHWKS